MLCTALGIHHDDIHAVLKEAKRVHGLDSNLVGRIQRLDNAYKELRRYSDVKADALLTEIAGACRPKAAHVTVLCLDALVAPPGHIPEPPPLPYAGLHDPLHDYDPWEMASGWSYKKSSATTLGKTSDAWTNYIPSISTYDTCQVDSDSLVWQIGVDDLVLEECIHRIISDDTWGLLRHQEECDIMCSHDFDAGSFPQGVISKHNYTELLHDQYSQDEPEHTNPIVHNLLVHSASWTDVQDDSWNHELGNSLDAAVSVPEPPCSVDSIPSVASAICIHADCNQIAADAAQLSIDFEANELERVKIQEFIVRVSRKKDILDALLDKAQPANIPSLRASVDNLNREREPLEAQLVTLLHRRDLLVEQLGKLEAFGLGRI